MWPDVLWQCIWEATAGDEGGGLAYCGGSASTSKAVKSWRARLPATASLRKLRHSKRCSHDSMCTVESSASGTSNSKSRSAASTTSLKQRNGTPAKPRLVPPPLPPKVRAPGGAPAPATQNGSLAVQRLATVTLAMPPTPRARSPPSPGSPKALWRPGAGPAAVGGACPGITGLPGPWNRLALSGSGGIWESRLPMRSRRASPALAPSPASWPRGSTAGRWRPGALEPRRPLRGSPAAPSC
mmetsp:Transcript_85626/g.266503  ORF Transcript_85626/g.266503 Transcript_85626/m.266503 type:complete len:241 (-) Transcript_85626:150-872(-)